MNKFGLKILSILFIIVSCTSETDKLFLKNMENNLSFSTKSLQVTHDMFYCYYCNNPLKVKSFKFKADTIYNNFLQFDSICKKYLTENTKLTSTDLLKLYSLFEEKLNKYIQKGNYIDQSVFFKVDKDSLLNIKDKKLMSLVLRNYLAMNTTYLIKFFMEQVESADDYFVTYDDFYFRKESSSKTNSYNFSISSAALSAFPQKNRILIDSVMYNNQKFCGEISPYSSENFEKQISVTHDERIYTMKMDSLNHGYYNVYGKIIIEFGSPLYIKVKPFRYKFEIEKNKTSH